tara:strand:- start:27 stop:461 length:435 start_codon:yes stop_codon:yes gene_type:complete
MIEGYKTAISRRGLSAPMRWLQDHHRIQGRALDYGCGRGQDADRLGVMKYDPHWHPVDLGGQFFDVITCIYVLNVISDNKKISDILADINFMLTSIGTAYIVVRRDIPHEGTATQRWIDLHWPCISIKKNSKFEIYSMGVMALA